MVHDATGHETRGPLTVFKDPVLQLGLPQVELASLGSYLDMFSNVSQELDFDWLLKDAVVV